MKIKHIVIKEGRGYYMDDGEHLIQGKRYLSGGKEQWHKPKLEDIVNHALKEFDSAWSVMRFDIDPITLEGKQNQGGVENLGERRTAEIWLIKK